jgi:hypothetical protein
MRDEAIARCGVNRCAQARRVEVADHAHVERAALAAGKARVRHREIGVAGKAAAIVRQRDAPVDIAGCALAPDSRQRRHGRVLDLRRARECAPALAPLRLQDAVAKRDIQGCIGSAVAPRCCHRRAGEYRRAGKFSATLNAQRRVAGDVEQSRASEIQRRLAQAAAHLEVHGDGVKRAFGAQRGGAYAKLAAACVHDLRVDGDALRRQADIGDEAATCAGRQAIDRASDVEIGGDAGGGECRISLCGERAPLRVELCQRQRMLGHADVGRSGERLA